MIKTIAVIGAGTMGHGIAASFAMYGYDIRLFDPNEAVLEKAKPLIGTELALLLEEGVITAENVAATLERITLSGALPTALAGCDYVIEAAPEILELKQDLLASCDALCQPDTILATNTSSLALDGMMKKLGPARRQRTMVCHWYNPALLIPIVELSFFGNMPADIFEEVRTLYRSIRKQTVKVLKDVPGLVANRIQQGVAREVFSIIEQGIAEPEDVDRALKFGPGFRYATTGQLEVADFGGLDIWCVVGDNLLAVMDNSKQANPLLREKVAQGKLGVKSGEGFFRYPAEDISTIRERFLRRLIHQLKASEAYD